MSNARSKCLILPKPLWLGQCHTEQGQMHKEVRQYLMSLVRQETRCIALSTRDLDIHCVSITSYLCKNPSHQYIYRSTSRLPITIRDLQSIFQVPIRIHQPPMRFPAISISIVNDLPRLIKRLEPVRNKKSVNLPIHFQTHDNNKTYQK